MCSKSITIEETEFLAYLNSGVSNTSTGTSIQWQTSIEDKASVIECANEISSHIKQQRELGCDLLVFRTIGYKAQHRRVTDTQCKPGIVAAFETKWSGDSIVYWPFIELAGGDAPEGKSDTEQHNQAISYLHHLLLARPDLHVAHALLVSKTSVTLFVGISGKGVSHIALAFGDARLRPLLYALIRHIYDPGAFKDKTDKVAFDVVQHTCMYTLTVDVGTNGQSQLMECPNFEATYAGPPFSTRTTVFVNTGSPTLVNGVPLRVVKDQYCTEGTRFDEPGILEHIHEDGTVPGVVEMIYHEILSTPKLENARIKRRLGFKQLGYSFSSISTFRMMLEISFDILEVTRYLRTKRQVLHRDISVGNIVWIPEAPNTNRKNTTNQINQHEPRELDMCFVNYLLGYSDNPRETSALLIDFNRAERRGSKETWEHERHKRTGTPLFIARAVQHGGPYPDLYFDKLPAVPQAVQIYELNHAQRSQLFNDIGKTILDSDTAIQAPSDWRHELYHDAESIFWLMLYWSMCAKPKDESSNDTEPIQLSLWSNLVGGKTTRTLLLQKATIRNLHLTHSKFRPVHALVMQLAEIIYVDQDHLPADDRRRRPEYVHEAFQRIILKFILDNREAAFMDLKVDKAHRLVDTGMPNQNILVTTTPSQSTTPDPPMGSKRPLTQPENQQDAAEDSIGRSKRARLDESEEYAM